MSDLKKFAEMASAVLAEPEPSEYTWKMKIAVALHDLVAHPLLWLTHDAGWAWAFHDWLGEIAMRGAADATGIRITGAGMLQAIEDLASLGWKMTAYSPRMSEIHSPMQSSTTTWEPPPVEHLRIQPRHSLEIVVRGFGEKTEVVIDFVSRTIYLSGKDVLELRAALNKACEPQPADPSETTDGGDHV